MRLRAVFIMLALSLAPAFGQVATVTLAASHLANAAGKPVSGQFCFSPTNNNGGPQGFTFGGGGQSTQGVVCVPVNGGAMTTPVVDTALSNPANVCIAAQLTNPSAPPATRLVRSYSCLQPASTGQSSWCSTSGGVTTCNLDNYVAPGTPGTLVVSGPAGVNGTNGAPGPNCSVSSAPGHCDLGTTELDTGAVMAGIASANASYVPTTTPAVLVNVGDSYAQGYKVTPSTMITWKRLADLFGVASGSRFDYSHGGDQKADVARNQLFNHFSPSLADPQTLILDMSGTNDASKKGPGAYEATFNDVSNGILTFYGIWLEYKVMGASMVSTCTGTCAVDTRYDTGSFTLNRGIKTTAIGSTYHGTITTTKSGPQYLWATSIDGDTGVTGYVVKNGSGTTVASGTWSTAEAAPIATYNGATESPILAAKTPVLPPGTYTWTFTQTAAGTSATMGFGVVPDLPIQQLPHLLESDIPPRSYCSTLPVINTDTYRALTVANVLAAQADGLNPTLWRGSNYINPSAAAAQYDADCLHPVAAGADRLYAAALDGLHILPGAQLTPAAPQKLITTDYTFDPNDRIDFFSCPTACTLTVPSLVGNYGPYDIKNISTAPLTIVHTGGGDLPSTLTQNQALRVVDYGGNNWWNFSPGSSTSASRNLPQAIKTGDYTFDPANDGIIHFNCSAPCTLTLPSTSGDSGPYFANNIGTQPLSIAHPAGGDLPSVPLTQNQAIQFAVKGGTNWWDMGRNYVTPATPPAVPIHATAFTGSGTIAGTGSYWFRYTPVAAVSLKRLETSLNATPAGCTTPATLALLECVSPTTTSCGSYGAPFTSVPLVNGQSYYDSGALSVTIPAGTVLMYRITVGPAGCTTQAGSPTFTMQVQ